MYNYTDHLGNVRLSYTQKGDNLEILEETHYYPFGLSHKGYNNVNNQLGYKYKYNGKELQEELNLNIYDYGARNYDPALGRFFTIDPLAEKTLSLYDYVWNNPLNLIDPTGKMPENPPIGNDYNTGYQHIDQDGSWYFEKHSSSEGLWIPAGSNTEKTYDTYGNRVETIESIAVTGTRASGTSERGALSIASSTNSYIGLAGTGLENVSGSFRLSTTNQGFSPKYYGNAWNGNQYAKTYNISKVGSALGKVGLGVGTALDMAGVSQYYKYGGSSSGAVSPVKAGSNFGMGMYGVYGGPFGVIISSFYVGTELFVPGGTETLLERQAQIQEETQAIIGNSWRMIPFSNK